MQKHGHGTGSFAKQLFVYISLALIARAGQHMFHHVQRVNDLHNTWTRINDKLPLTKFQITKEKVGFGAEALFENKIMCNYQIRLMAQGQLIEERDNNSPDDRKKSADPMVLNWNWHIPGFIIAIVGHPELGIPPMRVGGKRTINVPASHGYENYRKHLNIGPTFDLVIELELITLVREKCDFDFYDTVCYDKREKRIEEEVDFITAQRLALG